MWYSPWGGRSDHPAAEFGGVCADQVPVALLVSGSFALPRGEASPALCSSVMSMGNEAGTRQLLYEGPYSGWFNGCRLSPLLSALISWSCKDGVWKPDSLGGCLPCCSICRFVWLQWAWLVTYAEPCNPTSCLFVMRLCSCSWRTWG